MLVRLPDLAVVNVEITDHTFENCRIVGPSVIFPVSCEFHNCGWGAQDGDVESVLWEVDPARRRHLVGAIGLTRCKFYSCQFEGIGLAGNAEALDYFRQAFGGG